MFYAGFYQDVVVGTTSYPFCVGDGSFESPGSGKSIPSFLTVLAAGYRSQNLPYVISIIRTLTLTLARYYRRRYKKPVIRQFDPSRGKQKKVSMTRYQVVQK